MIDSDSNRVILPKGDTVTILNCLFIGLIPQWCQIQWKDQVGYTLLNSLNETNELNDYIAKKTTEKMIDIYGEDIALKILNNQIWIGMTDKMARLSLGDPDDINRTVSSSGVQEQWVYGDKYLYFDNEILTSWQE